MYLPFFPTIYVVSARAGERVQVKEYEEKGKG